MLHLPFIPLGGAEKPPRYHRLKLMTRWMLFKNFINILNENNVQLLMFFSNSLRICYCSDGGLHSRVTFMTISYVSHHWVDHFRLQRCKFLAHCCLQFINCCQSVYIDASNTQTEREVDSNRCLYGNTDCNRFIILDKWLNNRYARCTLAQSVAQNETSQQKK